MDEKKLLDMDLEMGFANAALVDTKDVVFNPVFRPLCEENLCGKYIENPLDDSLTKPAKGKHNKLTREWIGKAGMPGLMIGASGCNLCDPCAIVDGQPCRFPKQKFSCMSAYCIFVRDLAEKCGMDYDCGPGIVAFFSMYCFSTQ